MDLDLCHSQSSVHLPGTHGYDYRRIRRLCSFRTSLIIEFVMYFNITNQIYFLLLVYGYMGICVFIEDKEGTLSVSYILYS